MYWINLCFLVTEFIVGIVVINNSLNVLAGAFHRTTAPLLDGKFSKKYEAEGENFVGTTKQYKLGMKKLNVGDSSQHFDDVEDFD